MSKSNTFNSIAQNDIVLICILIDTFNSAKRSSLSNFMIVIKQHLTQNLNHKAGRIFLAQNNFLKRENLNTKLQVQCVTSYNTKYFPSISLSFFIFSSYLLAIPI